MTKIAFFLLVLPTLALSLPQGRIIGGFDADDGDFPFVVALHITGGAQFCAGAILSNRWVVTTGNCANTTGGAPNLITVIAGSVNRNQGAAYLVAQIIIHPAFDPSTFASDIALLKVDTDIEFSDRVAPVSFSAYYTPGSSRAYATGWGYGVGPGGVLPAPNLKGLYTEVLWNDKCKERTGEAEEGDGERLVGEGTVCTSQVSGRGVCIGDQGGPLVTADLRTLIGLTSWMMPCARGEPDGFTRVSQYFYWISTSID